MVDFLVIGYINSISYNNIHQLLVNSKFGFGYNKVGNYKGEMSSPGEWFSNISDYYPPKLELKKHYNEIDYDRFDNYDCINVDRISDIPSDYDGLMGVPVSFLDVWNPEQFELIGFPGIGIVPEGWKGMTEDFIKLYYEQGNTGCYEVGKKMGYFVKDGKAIIPYVRLLIKKKKKGL